MASNSTTHIFDPSKIVLAPPMCGFSDPNNIPKLRLPEPVSEEEENQYWLGMADFALRHYNASEGTDFEAVEVPYAGPYWWRLICFGYHLIFLAKRKNMNDSSTQQFFAEVYNLPAHGDKFLFKLCMPMDPSNSVSAKEHCHGCKPITDVMHPSGVKFFEGPRGIPASKFDVTGGDSQGETEVDDF